MPFDINPPQTPLGTVTLPNGQVAQIQIQAEWYRYFARVQKVIGGDPSPFDETSFLSGIPGHGEHVSERSVREAPFYERPIPPSPGGNDDLTPLARANEPEDNLTPPAPVQPAHYDLTPPSVQPQSNDDLLNPYPARSSEGVIVGPGYVDMAFAGVSLFRVYSNGVAVFFGPFLSGLYTVATLPNPAIEGWEVYATDLRVFDGAGTLEGAGTGTGGKVTYNGTNWVIVGTNVTAQA